MISASLSKYRAVFVIAFKQTWNNKANLSGLLFFLFILLFIYNRLWVVIGVQENANGLNATYIWYLLLAEIIILSGPKMERIMFEDIKSGNIAYYVNKPISFFLMRYIEGIGNMTVSFLIMGTFGTIVTLLLTGQPPFEWRHFPFIIIMCYLSSAINLLFYTGSACAACGWKASGPLAWQSNVWLLFSVVPFFRSVFIPAGLSKLHNGRPSIPSTTSASNWFMTSLGQTLPKRFCSTHFG